MKKCYSCEGELIGDELDYATCGHCGKRYVRPSEAIPQAPVFRVPWRPIALGLVAWALILLPLVASATHDTEPHTHFDWTQAMNQTSYWEDYIEANYPVVNANCTKYENHDGDLPAEYEFGVVKAGQLVAFYDARNLGNINMENPQNAYDRPSWVMKCNADPVTTTTPPTTVPPTTVPPTTVPPTTVPPTTVPPTTIPPTTIPETTTTLPPPTTVPPTTEPPTTSTTTPATTIPTETTSTIIVVTDPPPPTPPTDCEGDDGIAGTADDTCLPHTGLSTETFALIGAGLLLSGGLVSRLNRDTKVIRRG